VTTKNKEIYSMPFKKPEDNHGLVPFGRYAGKPIEAMAQDPGYCEYLLKQPWFKEQYGNVYQVIVNNFSEPSETPESNELQARFLDPVFRQRFAMAVNPSFADFASDDGLASAAAFAASDIAFVKHGMQIDKARATNNEQQWAAEAEVNDLAFRAVLSPETFQTTVPEFEIDGTDVIFKSKGPGFEYSRVCQCLVSGKWQESGNFWHRDSDYSRSYPAVKNASWRHRQSFRIEIKPEVGDDYPAILRQMRRSKANILFTRAYNGAGADEATFVEFFSTQGIRIVFEYDVLTAVIPEPYQFDGKRAHELIAGRLKEIESDQKRT
jgi:hypothetical protein